MNPYSDHQSSNKSELLELGLPIVTRTAHYLRGRVPDHVSIEDMIQIGTIGLMEAEATFDQSTGVKFVDFAKQRVRGAILDEVRKQSSISRLAIKNRQAHAEADKKLQQSLGREPRNSEVAVELGITLAEYEKQRVHAERFRLAWRRRGWGRQAGQSALLRASRSSCSATRVVQKPKMESVVGQHETP